MGIDNKSIVFFVAVELPTIIPSFLDHIISCLSTFSVIIVVPVFALVLPFVLPVLLFS